MGSELKLIVLVSGKRKSGKDFLTARLLAALSPDVAQVVRISEPIKRHWAELHGLDLAAMLGDGPYKERFRREMIEWSDARRAEDPGFFCREAMSLVTRPVVVVSDTRRRTDLRWFGETFPGRVRTVRIEASEATRTTRGWRFEIGVDDIASECDLDGERFDLVLRNDTEADAERALAELEALVRREAGV